jgi:GTP-binding protein
MSQTPTVAIVGRPNVGKSTLFNRLLGSRKAIVHDQPGVTRDRITGLGEVEDGQSVLWIDTGGLVPGEDVLGLNKQVLLAVEESDLLVLLVDGKQGLVTADEQVWSELRRFGKPTVLAVNKADTGAAQQAFHEFHALGIEPQILISAEHALGIGDLREAMSRLLPAGPEAESPTAPALAIVGRPNVGKSSLLNRLLGEPRALVSEQAGTTRDPVDSLLESGDQSYLLIDTAGIRRRSKVSGTPEELAVMMARRQVERADLALLVVDAAQGITSGDLAIAGAIWELGRAAVVLVNKWDLLEGTARERLEGSWPRLAEVLAGPNRVNVSALTGRGLDRVLPAVADALEAYRRQLGTAEVNRLFQEAARRHRPPAERGRPWKLYYATQVSAGPPTFMLFANRSLPRSSTYRRYLENFLRENLELPGVPARLVIRKR